MQHLAGGARTHGLRLSRMSSAVDARPDFSDGASHGLGVGHEDGIDKSVGVGLVEKAHGEDDLLHGDAVLFAVVGDLHALGVAEDGCEDARRILVSSSHKLVGLMAETGGWSLLPPTNLWCGRMFLENLVIEPVQASVRRRRMWFVGDRRSAAEAVMLTAETAAKVFEEKILPTLEEAQDGLSSHAMLVEHGKRK